MKVTARYSRPRTAYYFISQIIIISIDEYNE